MQRETLTNVIQGDCIIAEEETAVLTTVLGSCIAVCMYDAHRRIGGMNHFLLPKREGVAGENVRYGAYAMELLINGLLRKGAERGKLEAKVFGGASMMGNLRDIGASNAEFTRRFLRDEGIPCTAESTGGTSARRIRFWPSSGRVRQLLVSGEVEAIVSQRPAPLPARQASDITLF
jgi:chemotaxis protein CheD